MIDLSQSFECSEIRNNSYSEKYNFSSYEKPIRAQINWC